MPSARFVICCLCYLSPDLHAASVICYLSLSMSTHTQRLRIVEMTLDHEAPLFSNMRRRNSRKDSDLTGVVDLRCDLTGVVDLRCEKGDY